MYKPFELFVGLRYTRAKRRNHFISFISLSSMLGITLGVMALITVMSVMNGFEKEVRERMLGAIAHLTIMDFEGKINNWPHVIKNVKDHPKVKGAAPFIRAEGMLIYAGNVNGTVIRGVLPKEETAVSEIGDKMVEGKFASLEPGKFRILLGYDLARRIGADVGDKVTMVTPSVNVTPAGVAPRMKRFTVAGIFQFGHDFYDTTLAVVHMDDAAKLLRMQGKASGVRVQVDDLFDAPFVRQELSASDELVRYWIRDWSHFHSNWFRAVKIEKRMIFLLLMLIIAVAAFNIVSTLVMVVTDKESDIAILRTLGASPGMITRIFIIQGTLIGTVGTILGVILGVALSLNVDTVISFIEGLFGFQVLDPSVYYISHFPSDLHWSDVWVISIVSFLLGVGSTIYPARRASRTQPALALRYE
ncbi:MAG: lipoprotein-releasing ABC transporter permease subunit [Gammaproteobacteria bacterium]|nr:lipoprotein-releasing ABC transporter permease subunit [Gammaproteobacteria bacterium]MDH5778811.1 lipoprotein-releasing ABC transporter permease subunit [Gammaproteobacteria bacterium]